MELDRARNEFDKWESERLVRELRDETQSLKRKNELLEGELNMLLNHVENLNMQYKNHINTHEEQLCDVKRRLMLLQGMQNIIDTTHEEVEEKIKQQGDGPETARLLGALCVFLTQ